MKIEGTFQGMDPVQTGVSQAGNSWQKSYFEIITNEWERSRRVAFCAFGNTVEQVKAVARGATVEVKFTAESRDYIDKNGQKRYGTDLNCYGLAVITRQPLQAQYIPAQPAQPQYQQSQPAQAAPAPSQLPPTQANIPFSPQSKNYGMPY